MEKINRTFIMPSIALALSLLIILSSCKKDEVTEPIIKNEIIPQYNISRVVDGKEITNIILTNDGGYVGTARATDFNVIKFDSEFNVIWDKSFGGSENDYAQSVIQTNDGSYMVIGVTGSSDGDVSTNHGGNDIWLCNLSADGELVWEKSYGGTSDDGVGTENALKQTTDGGFIFIGYTTSDDIDVSANHGGIDIWVVKIIPSGSIVSEKTFGGSKDDYGRNLVSSNVYTFLAKVNSTNADFNEEGCWIVQIDESFNMVWKTNLFGINTGFINSTKDGGFVAVNSSFTDITLNKLSSDGKVSISKTINFQATSSKQPSASKILQTADEGYFIIGELGNGVESDALLFRVDPNFNLLYQQLYKGSNFDMSEVLLPIGTNKYIYQYVTRSKDILDVNYTSFGASVFNTLEEN